MLKRGISEMKIKELIKVLDRYDPDMVVNVITAEGKVEVAEKIDVMKSKLKGFEFYLICKGDK